MNYRVYIVAAFLALGLFACTNASTRLLVAPTSPPETLSPNTPAATAVTTGPTPAPEPTREAGTIGGILPALLPTSTALPPMPAPAVLPDAPDRDLYRLAAELSKLGEGEVARVVNPAPVTYVAGRGDTFWLIDLPELRVYPGRFELRLVTPHAYWYFEEGQAVPQADIERSAARFEQEVYPRVTSAFGQEWSPGVDNDPHLNILNARLRGVAGYYSSSDEYPYRVNQYSNQREVIYISTAAVRVGTTDYLEVLAHELQHAVHWNADPSEETWVNEGLSELAVTIAGISQDSLNRFLISKPTSLVNWPLSAFDSGANYVSASLFMHYLSEHYGDRNDLRALLRAPEDGIAGITAYLQASGYDADFRDVFRDWAVANFLDEDQGPYGYSGLEVHTRVTKTIDKFSELNSQIPQYAVEYVELASFVGPLRLRFRGLNENQLLPTEVGRHGCWWGNSGDSINATLTGRVDLTGLDRAVLHYQVWFNLEEKWDYAYLEVSVDGGRTWNILATPNTTAENPIGASFGMGYTGDSLGWIDESVDLSSYTGQRVLLRFQHITDDAVNGAGICVRGISIPEAGLVDLTEGWQNDGFLFTDNRVKQDYIVQVMMIGPQNQVKVVELDEANSGEIIVPAPQGMDRLVVAVAALAPKTRVEASYTLTVAPAS